MAMVTAQAPVPVHYDWKRYWCPRDGLLNLSDGGYLVPPTGVLGGLRTHVVPYSEIDHCHGIVLLGEPGIGKSTEVEETLRTLQANSSITNDTVLCLDLERCRDYSYLKTNLLDGSDYSAWTEGSHKLYVFFENFERLGMPAHLFAQDLQAAFEDSPLERLYLRFISRTFEWSSSLENRLYKLFKDDIAICELAPLTRMDVELAATAVLGDSKTFMEDISRADIVPLAVSPITLRFILNKYKRGGKLPASATELYTDGCEILCEESNDDLRDSGSIGYLAPKQRLAVASRIAAVLMFSQKYAVWTGADKGEVPEEDVKLTELVGGKERFDGVEVEVTMDALRETLKTGLFSSRGINRFGFAHQSYAEFLAAVFFRERHTKPKQLLSLLLHSGDPDKRVVPQLAAVAGWVASFVPEVFNCVVECDPQALLTSDLEKLTGADRRRVVGSFLNLLKDERISLWEVSQRYAKLNHPDLDQQIREVIHDVGRDILVRREALRIAGACKVKSLEDDFIKIALDPKEPDEVRQYAGLSLTEVDDPSAVHKLLPLALGQAGNDPDDELKGLGLAAVYPNHLTTAQLFNILTPAKNQSLFGAYQYFLSYTLFERIPQTDIPIALDWVLKTDRRRNRTLVTREERFSDDIMWFGWQHCDDNNVLQHFAEVALARVQRFDEIVGGFHRRDFETSIIALTDRRRALIRLLVQLAARKRKTTVFDLSFAIRTVVTADDFDWLIDELMLVRSGRTRELLVQLAVMAYSFRTDHLDTLLIKAKNEADVQAQFTWLKKVYELGAAESLKEKQRYERLTGPKKRKLLEPPPSERISILLQKAEEGQAAAWYQLTQELTLEPDSTFYGDTIEPDIEELPGWVSADSDTRERIILAAKAFLEDPSCDPKSHEWLCTSSLSMVGIAGVKALVLLKNQREHELQALSNGVWERFFAALLVYPSLGKSDRRERQIDLLKEAYAHVPQTATRTIVDRIVFDISEYKHISISSAISGIIDQPLSDTLLNIVNDATLGLEVRGQMLRLLLDNKFGNARAWADDLLTKREKGTVDALTASAVVGLVNNWTGEEWAKTWDTILQDGDFGDLILGEIVPWWRTHSFLQRLTDDQLADLFIWMHERYPVANNPNTEIVKRMGPSDLLNDLKLQIPTYLSRRGTASAADALSKILARFPELVGVESMVAECQAKFRRTSWIPYPPQYILQLANNAEIRLVSSERELMDVVVESLDRLQRELKDHGGTVEQLWNAVPIAYVNEKTGDKAKKGEHGKKKYLPRDEAAFCNLVAAHLNRDLKDRGVIINREVQIRVNPGAKGERTDIHVDAVAKAEHSFAFERVTVVIEAKGIWNPGLDTDMETQLVGQYLTESQCQSGIYLVAHFNCSQWDDDDYRKADSFKHELSQTQERLSAQAEGLSTDSLTVVAVVLDAALREPAAPNE